MNDQRPQKRPPFLDELRGELLQAAQDVPSASVLTTRTARVAVLLGGTAILVGGMIVGALLTFDRAEHRSEQGSGVSTAFAASGWIAETLPSLVANSQLVITGSVERVVPGAVIPDQGPGAVPGPAPIRHLNTVVEVDEALKGSARGSTVVVETFEEAFSGVPDWRKPGTEVALFLSPSNEGPGLHILSWSPESGPNYDQTVYVMDEKNDLHATSDDPLAEKVAELGLTGLRKAVSSDIPLPR